MLTGTRSRAIPGIRRLVEAGTATVLTALFVACSAPMANPTAPAAGVPNVPAATSTSVPAVKVPISTAASSSKEPVTIRLARGLAAEEPLWLMFVKPELTPNQGKVYRLDVSAVANTTDRVKGMEASALDGAQVGIDTLIFARSQGIKLKALGSIMVEATKGFSTPLVVAKDSNINSVADLRGKTIGVTGFRVTTELWVRRALQSAGLNPDRDVQMVPVSFTNVVDGVRTNKIAAGFLPQPFFAAEFPKGDLRVLTRVSDLIPFEQEQLLMVFTEDFINRHPEVVRAFMADFQAAARAYAQDPVAARKAILAAKIVQVPEQTYLTMEDYYHRPDGRVDVQSMEKFVNLMRDMGWLDQPVSVNELVDNSFLPQ